MNLKVLQHIVFVSFALVLVACDPRPDDFLKIDAYGVCSAHQDLGGMGVAMNVPDDHLLVYRVGKSVFEIFGVELAPKPCDQRLAVAGDWRCSALRVDCSSSVAGATRTRSPASTFF